MAGVNHNDDEDDDYEARTTAVAQRSMEIIRTSSLLSYVDIKYVHQVASLFPRFFPSNRSHFPCAVCLCLLMYASWTSIHLIMMTSTAPELLPDVARNSDDFACVNGRRRLPGHDLHLDDSIETMFDEPRAGSGPTGTPCVLCLSMIRDLTCRPCVGRERGNPLSRYSHNPAPVETFVSFLPLSLLIQQVHRSMHPAKENGSRGVDEKELRI